MPNLDMLISVSDLKLSNALNIRNVGGLVYYMQRNADACI